MLNKTPAIRIAIHEGETLVREEVFTQKAIRIGKAGEAHLRLGDQNVSRRHAEIEVLDSGEVRLTDLESTNGTLVNGVRVSQAVLRPGDEIMIGETKLVIDFEPTASRGGAETFFAPQAISDAPTGKSGLETALMWGDKVMNAGSFPVGTPVTMGEGAGCDFFVPEELIGGSQVQIAVPDGNDFLIDVVTTKPEGDFLVEGRIVRLPEMERRGLIEQGRYVRINANTKARLRFGEFTFLAFLSSLPEKPKSSFWKTFNMRDHSFFMVSLILHLLFLVLVSLVPEEQLKSSRDPYERNTQALKKIQVAMLERKIEEDKREEDEARKKLEEAKDVKTGSEIAIRPSEKPMVSKIIPEDNRERDREVADTALTRVMGQQQAMLDRVLDAAGPGLGGATMGIRVIGDRGMDAELAMGLDAFGGTLGAGGVGGFQGTGAWGGGSEFGPADLRGIAGLAKGDSDGASAKVQFKGGREPRLIVGLPTVSGELDRETVRRYIQTKLDQIRYCYQKEVQRNPDLAGQIQVEWIILPAGNVTAVKVASTSMNSDPVESCIVSRVQTWRFPSPKGGGTVRVRYPFMFKVTK
jgi:TonB family protein